MGRHFTEQGGNIPPFIVNINERQRQAIEAGWRSGITGYTQIRLCCKCNDNEGEGDRGAAPLFDPIERNCIK